MSSDYNGHTPFDPDPTPVGALAPQSDRVAGDEDDDTYADPSIYVRAEFIGGDPRINRMREISVTVPIRANDTVGQYAQLIRSVLGEIAKLGDLAHYEWGIDPGPIERREGTKYALEPHGDKA